MKLLLFAALVLLMGAGAGFWVYSDWTSPHLLSPAGEITLREKGGPGMTFPAASPEAASIISWISEHQTGWKLSVVTYAPHTTLSCDTFHLNVSQTSLILNYAGHKGSSRWIEVVRDLSPDERSFWQKVLARIKQSNHAM